MSFDVADVFTQSVRQAMPLAVAKQLHVSFDHHGPLAVAAGDGGSLARGFARLWTGVVDLIDAGYLVFYAHAQVSRPGKCLLTVKAAGTGLVAPPQAVAAVLQRLRLADDPAIGDGGRMRLRRAEGVCPFTGAPVTFASLPGEGVVLSAQWQLAVESTAPPPAGLESPGTAWIIQDDAVAADSLMRRLQRLGWSTTRFDSALPAERRLRAMARGDARPALVIAIEGGPVSAPSVQCLRPWLPAARLVYGACAGSPALGRGNPVPGFDVRERPFAPAELHGFGAPAIALQARAVGM